MLILKPLATQPCVEMKQEIHWTGKCTVETSYTIELYEDEVIAKQKRYPLKNVFDVSFYGQNGAIGFLYLHTNTGVISFFVKTKPTQFMNTFFELKQDNPDG